MDYDYQDKGNYFRGLLILIGKDNKIDSNERKTILEIGEKLGFEHKFCDDAVTDFLNNKFINLEPPKFSIQTIAKSFIEDGITLSLVDNNLHSEELEWLTKVVEENEISNEWFDQVLRTFVTNYKQKDIVN